MARRAKKTRDESELKIGVQGFVRALAVDARTGKVLAERKTKNVVVDGGRNEIIRLISANGVTAGGKISHLELGIGTSSANVTDTALATATGNRATVAGSLLTNGTVQYTCSFDTAFATGAALQEVGLFNSSSAGTMFARAKFGTINKTSEMTLAFTYQLNFTTG